LRNARYQAFAGDPAATDDVAALVDRHVRWKVPRIGDAALDIGQMCGWLNAASVFVSRSKRAAVRDRWRRGLAAP